MSNALALVLAAPASLFLAVLAVRRLLHEKTKRRVERRMATPGRHRILTGMFDTLSRFCRDHDVACIPSYGTLLGLIRERGIIAWDDDVDVFVLHSEWHRLCDLVARFNETFEGSYRLERQRILWHDRMTLHHSGSELTADILKIRPRTWLPVNVFLPDEWTFYAYIPKRSLHPIQRRCMRYADRELDLPARPEALLEHWFGHDWRIPRRPDARSLIGARRSLPSRSDLE